jgi:hypothetical protein
MLQLWQGSDGMTHGYYGVHSAMFSVQKQNGVHDLSEAEHHPLAQGRKGMQETFSKINKVKPNTLKK